VEPTEIDEFSKQMQEGGETGMKRVSLMISVLAVLVAMVTVLGHRTHTEAILSQTRASDSWNEYQGQKDRAAQDDHAAATLSLQPNRSDPDVQKEIAKDNAHSAKIKAELDDDQKKAKELDAEVHLAETRADRYDLGEALLQIAVVLSSITLLTRQHGYFFMGLTLGAVGLLMAASALLVH